MKKFFSLVLALVMALSLTTVAWGATITVTNSSTIDLTAGTTYDKLTLSTDVTDVVINGNGAIVAGIELTGVVTNLTVNNVVFTDDLSVGFKAFSASVYNDVNGLVVDGCTFNNGACVKVGNYYGSTQDLTNVTVKNSTFNGTDSDSDAEETRIYIISATNVTVTGNTVNAAEWNGIQLGGKANAALKHDGIIDIKNNTISNTGSRAMRVTALAATATLTMQNNTISNVLTNPSEAADPTNTQAMKIDGDSAVVTAAIAAATGNTYNGVNVTVNDAGAGVTKAGGKIVSGTFFQQPAAGDIATGYEAVQANGVWSVVPVGATAATESYVLVSTDIGAWTATGVSVFNYAAKNPTYNTDGISIADGNVAYTAFSAVPGNFVQVSTKAQADFTLYKADGTTFAGYYDNLENTPFYHGNGVAFYNFGKACTQYKDANFDATATYYTFEGDVYKAVSALEANAGNLMVNNTLVPVSTTSGTWVGHTVVYTYDKDFKVTGVSCSACGAVATIVPNYMSLPEQAIVDGTFGGPINTTMYYYWTNAVVKPVTPTTPSTDKVTSAETFDAGIAMYVGMSVMAAAGSAVVIGKKKD